MQALPIFINITDRTCVVVGGGDVAVRKVGTLLKANASVALISPEICHELQVLVDAKKSITVPCAITQPISFKALA